LTQLYIRSINLTFLVEFKLIFCNCYFHIIGNGGYGGGGKGGGGGYGGGGRGGGGYASQGGGYGGGGGGIDILRIL